MRRSIILATLAVFLLPALAAVAGVALARDSGKPTGGNKNYPPPRNDAGGVSYWGVVTELTKDSVTVRGPGEEPKRFPVSETLAAGKVPKEPRPIPGRRGYYLYPVTPACMYRLTDVKIGDWVTIRYSQVGGVVTCDHIQIDKRPGGRVPPLPDGVETPPRNLVIHRPDGTTVRREWIRYHEYWNAYWDLEDKGIPYPAKFGKWRRFPIAPMPRQISIPQPIQ